MTSLREIGTGTPSYAFAPVTGTIRYFKSPADVIASINEDLESTIALVDSGGTTFLGPILGRLGGIVSRDGTLRSHLAIVSREFEVPCLVGTTLSAEPADGTRVVLTNDGTVRLDDGSDVSAAWWAYINRVGDEIAVKDFDVTVDVAALDAMIAEELTDDKLEALIGHMGRTFKPEMTRRSGFTSELFPMMPYISLAMVEDFHSYPARVATVDAAMPAEEIGRRLRAAPGLGSPLWIWMVGYHYLCGRQALIQMGKLRPDERLDEVRTVVDFWRRLALAHRGDGTLDYKDAGFTNRYLPAGVVDSLASAAQPLDAASSKALKRLNATVSGYAFLYFCDSRVGICDSGPYLRPDGRHTIVRDYLSLGPSAWGYPWADKLDPPYAGLTMTLTFDPKTFTSFEINDWGTTFTEPDQLLTAVTEAAVVGHRRGGGSEPLAPDRWAEITTQISRSHLDLYQQFADMGRADRIFSAAQMYSWGLRPFAEVAGVLDKIDWSFSPESLALYPDPLDDDTYAGTMFGTAVVANDMPGSFSPIR
jgi:phosphohistidine swiveling domain-containing protein